MSSGIAAESSGGAVAEGSSTGRQIVRSGMIQMGSQGIQVALMIATGIILARILDPRDFGLYAMANTLLTFVVTFRDLGIPTAMVQRDKLDDSELSHLFWMNLRVNFLIAAAIALSGPFLAQFFREPKLAAITLLMAVGSFAAGLSAQPEGLLMRRMRYPALNAIEIGSFVAGSVSAIILALRGWGHWSLVAQFLVMSALRSVSIWTSAGWRPSRVRARGAGVTHHDLLSYGRNLSGFRAIDHIARHLGQILVGYSQGATAAGFYFNAYTWAGYPVQKVLTPLQRIAVSGLSRLQDDPSRFLSSLTKASLLITGAVLPLLTFFAVEPSLTIGVLLGAKWLPAAPIFRMLALASMALAVTRLALWINLSTGNSGRQFKWGIIRGLILGTAALVGLQWGAVGVATAYAIASWAQTGPEILYCLGASRIKPRDIAAMVARPLVCCVAAAASVVLVDSLTTTTGEGWIDLVARAAVFGAVYVSAWLAIPGGRTVTSQLLRIPALGFREP